MVDGGQGLSFGPLLRRCRLAAGMTQAELAGASGLSVRAISDMERGRTGRPQRKSVELLAGALGRGGEGARGLVEAARAARLTPERDPLPFDGFAPSCELPPDIPDFTAREHALRRLGSALSPGGRRPTGAPPPGQRLTLVVGHPGAGKTALAVHAAHLSRSRFPDGQIYVDLAPAGRPAHGPHEVVRRILQSLGAADGAAAPLEEASARLRAVLARRRVLIVLDDAVSEVQIRCARPAVGESAVIATCRRRLTALAGAECVEAPPFSPEESLAFLARMVGEDRVRAERSDAALVAELCGHLPLALRVVGCRLLARPHWTMRTLADEVLHDPRTRLRELSSGDLTVRSVMAAAFGALDARTRSALRTLAADGAPDFSPHSAAATLGCSVARAHRIIGDLMDIQLVAVLDGPPGQPRCLVPPVVRLFAAEEAEPVGGAAGPVGAPAGQRVV